jgi:uracil-DNA glycosylase family 4
MLPEGTGASGVYACAEALGEHEAAAGLPLRPEAPAGNVFDRTLRRASVPRESLAISNVIHCRPGNKNLLEHQSYEYEAINHCQVHMDREIQQFKPKVILAMGGIPLRTFTGFCGPKRSITHVRGFFLDGVRYPGIPVVSTYHPSYIQRDKPNLLGVLRLDILRAVALAKSGGKFSRPVKRYQKFPNISEAEEWLRWARLHPELPIMRDIETSESIGGDESELKVLSDGTMQIQVLKEEFQDAPEEEKDREEAVDAAWSATIPSGQTRITQVQFSIHGDGDAIIVPWDGGPFSRFVISVLRLPNIGLSWNGWTFDDPLLESHGVTIDSPSHDLMWAWHHLQPDLPRGLQYGTSFYIPEAEPWKHRAQDDPGDYGGDDVNYPRQFGPKLLDALKQRGIWSGYERHVLRLHPILVGASRRGIPVDEGRRRELGEKVDELKAGVDQELQGMFPDHLRNCEPKEGYVNPKIAEKRKQEPLEEGERWAERWFSGRSVESRSKNIRQTIPATCKVAAQIVGIGEAGPGSGNYDGEIHGKQQLSTVPATASGASINDNSGEALHTTTIESISSHGQDELRNCEPKEGYVSSKIADKCCNEPHEDGEKWGQRTFTEEANSQGNGTIGGNHSNNAVENSEEDRLGGLGSTTGNNPSNAVQRWCRIQPFLPNSSQQILRYIKWRREEEVQAKIATYRGNSRWANWPDRALREMAERNAVYKVPKVWREDKETTAKKELERLGAKTGDRFFSLVVEHREYGKVKSTYVAGWAPAIDGRTHPTFGFGPATGQLSSVRPASMTMPNPGGEETAAEARKTALARMCRGMVVAPPGYRLVFFDKKSFHATTLGFNAQDPLYLRITKKDIHSFVTANFMWMNERAEFLRTGLPGNPESWPNRSDEELGELLGIVKKLWKAIRDKKAKPTILGIGLGLGDAKCFEMNKRDEINPRGFDSKAEVTRFKNVLKGLFPAIFKFHERTKDLAHRQSFLLTRHCFMRWFFDVYHNVQKGGQWIQEAGKDAEAAIALPVQNDAHGMLKEEMLTLEELGAMERFGFMNVVHDELQFCCPEKLVEECMDAVPGVMNQPSKVLIDPVVAPGGLICQVEIKMGRSWSELEEVKLCQKALAV